MPVQAEAWLVSIRERMFSGPLFPGTSAWLRPCMTLKETLKLERERQTCNLPPFIWPLHFVCIGFIGFNFVYRFHTVVGDQNDHLLEWSIQMNRNKYKTVPRWFTAILDNSLHWEGPEQACRVQEAALSTDCCLCWCDAAMPGLPQGAAKVSRAGSEGQPYSQSLMNGF